MTFIYGAEGVIVFMINGISYLYRKNLFGDVTEIYNETRELVGKYSYTAFGECTVEVDVGQIATKNPIRYRSYCYDEEINLYYLKTRYYDPETGRFMTIDDVKFIAPNTINGLNLYAYCANNPIVNVDPQGTSFWSAIGNFFKNVGKFLGGLALALVGVAVTLVTLPAAAIMPGGGFLTNIGLSMTMYGGFVLSSVFDSQINSEMQSIGWNPFNNNESAVLAANKVSFYKGQAVIKGNFPGCMSFGVMFADRGAWVTADTIQHEYGHFLQMGILGDLKFALGIALPSLIGTWVTPSNLYHSQPWEVTADILGGTRAYTHVKNSELIGMIYFLLLVL